MHLSLEQERRSADNGVKGREEYMRLHWRICIDGCFHSSPSSDEAGFGFCRRDVGRPEIIRSAKVSAEDR